jgi:hypothetical protein
MWLTRFHLEEGGAGIACGATGNILAFVLVFGKVMDIFRRVAWMIKRRRKKI